LLHCPVKTTRALYMISICIYIYIKKLKKTYLGPHKEVASLPRKTGLHCLPRDHRAGRESYGQTRPFAPAWARPIKQRRLCAVRYSKHESVWFSIGITKSTQVCFFPSQTILTPYKQTRETISFFCPSIPYFQAATSVWNSAQSFESLTVRTFIPYFRAAILHTANIFFRENSTIEG
jgi:hypothetical protein